MQSLLLLLFSAGELDWFWKEPIIGGKEVLFLGIFLRVVGSFVGNGGRKVAGGRKFWKGRCGDWSWKSIEFGVNGAAELGSLKRTRCDILGRATGASALHVRLTPEARGASNGREAVRSI